MEPHASGRVFGEYPTAVLTPDTLVLDGRFRVLRSLGAGGMGEVYLGEQVSLGRKVAIKVLHHDLHLQPGMAERFKREARILSAVEHPAVVRVIDFGESGDAACLVMELVEGDSLHKALGEGPFPPARALPLLHQLAEGLAAIHDKGIIHRDLKPENVVLSRGPRGEQARLLDFGIARFAESDGASNLSQIGVVLGTPEYLSPEQAVGAKADTRSDLYSFGVLAYRVFSGRLPFDGPGARQYLAQHAHGTPRPLLEAAPELARHPTLAGLVMRLLEKDPAHRFASAHELADALAAANLSVATAPSVSAASPSAPLPPAGTQAFGPAAPAVLPSSGTAAFGTAPLTAPSGTVVFGTGPSAPATEGNVPASAPPVVAPTSVGAPAFTVRPASGLSVTSGTLSLKSQNLAVMLTDIKGFTERTSRQTREENARMLETHDKLLLPLLREYDGKLVQKRGDALLAVFRSPTSSVLCGMAMQDRLWRHNQVAPPEEQLHVRVCIHAGEVLLSKDSVLGEPVEVVEGVEHVAEADDVTFTEAVNLARNRTGVDAEPCGTIPLPGRGEQLQLYRVLRVAEGPPYGERFAVKQGLALSARLAPVGRTVVDGAQRVQALVVPKAKAAWSLVLPKARAVWAKLAAWLKGHPKHLLVVGTASALVLSGGAALALHQRSPVTRARALLAEGKPAEALKHLQSVPAEEAKGDAALQRVRARALHAQGQHEAEHSVLAALKDDGRADAESEVLDALAEDFGEDEGDRGLRRLLGAFPKDTLRDHFEDLAEDDASPKQWGALRYLVSEKHTQGLDLPEAYATALASKSCTVRAKAARELAELGDADAVPALTKLAELPREKGVIGSKNCGQDEAAAAIQALKKKSD
jgi:serine/threonine-protein kinase